ncbi:MAG: hypothetical protein HS122_09595 [Opitutaceae bacterium]|nr:hypothetical protein [Opitutaceae bacterium]
MKLASLKSASWLVVAAALAAVTPAKAVSFNYSSSTDATINFLGAGKFDFSAVPNFDVTSGSAIGTANGSIIAPVGGWVIGPGAVTAAVTGVGTMSIFDGTYTLTADLAWNSISQLGAGGTLNYLASLNLSNIVYAGSNADLLALYNDAGGINTLTFQFSSVKTLDDLRAGGISNSFSGTITSQRVADGGMTAVLLGLGLVSVGFFARRRLS